MNRPVWEMLERNCSRQSLHMPGHKGKAPFGEMAAYALDTTELPGTDDLYCPEGGLLEAERLYARAAGSGATLLMHNGSTQGIQTMLLMWARENDTIILPRNAHLSAVNGCVIGGMKPVWLPMRFTGDGYGYIPEETVLATLAKHPEAKCLMLTRPDFYGGVLPLERIVKAAHAQGCRVAVDEAHGAHFPWMEGAWSAGDFGADAWVQSCHKTLPSLTSTAVLHVRDPADRETARRLMRLTQTSSPSFLLMQSIDDARAFMEQQGRGRLRRLIALTNTLRGKLCEVGYGDAHALWTNTGLHFDPTRLVIHAPQGGEALDAALGRQGLDVEMHDLRRVVCILSVMDGCEELDRLWRALEHIPAQIRELPSPPYDQPMPEQAMLPRQAVMGRTERVNVRAAEGRIAAASAGLYPPGIPLVAPGERISAATVEALALAGARMRFGVEGEELLCVK